jgi:hypothetical protein
LRHCGPIDVYKSPSPVTGGKTSGRVRILQPYTVSETHWIRCQLSSDPSGVIYNRQRFSWAIFSAYWCDGGRLPASRQKARSNTQTRRHSAVWVEKRFITFRASPGEPKIYATSSVRRRDHQSETPEQVTECYSRTVSAILSDAEPIEDGVEFRTLLSSLNPNYGTTAALFMTLNGINHNEPLNHLRGLSIRLCLFGTF